MTDRSGRATGSRIKDKNPDRSGNMLFYAKSPGSTGPDELLQRPSSRHQTPYTGAVASWLEDGSLVYSTNTDIWRTTTAGDGGAVPIVATQFIETFAALSDDNRWLAYASNETGRYEIYATPYPSAPTKWPISKAGGVDPAWRRDGKELFYLGASGELMAVAVAADAPFTVGEPQRIVETGYSPLLNPSYTRNNYAVTADGQRFLIAQPAGTPLAAGIGVVVGWTAGPKPVPAS